LETKTQRSVSALKAITLVIAVLPIGAAGLTPTTLTLTSSPNPATLGQAVTLTATTSAVVSGRVTFYDGVTVLGTGTLVGGQATLTTKFLPSGSRSLSAYYAGNASFAPISSAPVHQTIFALRQNGFRSVTTPDAGQGTSSTSAVVGDFNGDGRPDVALLINGESTTSSGAVSVLLGKGDGSFQAAVHYNFAGPVSSLVAEDFNGDGKTDFAISSSGNVSVMLGNGDGTFQAAVTAGTATSLDRLVVADFNGDGNADLGLISTSVRVLLGNGDGTFRAAINSSGTAISVAVGDFNGDGKVDLAVISGVSVASVLLGNGDGTFQTPVNYTLAPSSQFIAVGDFNGDGKADLATYGPNYGVGDVLLGNGDGTFQPPIFHSAPGNTEATLAVGDFNGDGKTDLAFGGNFGMSVALGNGDGTFQNDVFVPASTSSCQTPFFLTAVVGDFNGDGVSDVVAVASDITLPCQSINVLLGVSATAASSPVFSAAGVTPAANYGETLAPGVIASLFGTNLAPGIASAIAVPIPTELEGVSVSVNGILAPLFYVSPSQINFQLPWELLALPVQARANVVVTVNGSASAGQSFLPQAVSPGIFTLNSSGSGQGAIQIANTAIFAAPPNIIPAALARPANRGEFVTIYCSGLGDVSPRPATGAPASDSPLSNTLLMPSVVIGGVGAQVTFAGLSPGYVGLYQVNAQVPSGSTTGGQVPVVITLGGVTSNVVTMAVQ